ncbi:MAG: hypothetical protein HKN82_13355 [Akkermansiaceae bacterium]|nr:hypothetical protein [Akkermansiaceae bacterium]NNM27987.1 hypothetical protein [Akkermansiaceae bacterium]
MARVLIVDGHSMVFASRELLAEHRANPRRARQSLIGRMNAYQGATDVSVVLVFDGRGSRETREGGDEGEALVIYSPAGTTADAVIERVAAAQAPRHQVTVASNDRMVLEAAMSSGAEAISIRILEGEMARRMDEFRDKWELG